MANFPVSPRKSRNKGNKSAEIVTTTLRRHQGEIGNPPMNPADEIATKIEPTKRRSADPVAGSGDMLHKFDERFRTLKDLQQTSVELSPTCGAQRNAGGPRRPKGCTEGHKPKPGNTAVVAGTSATAALSKSSRDRLTRAAGSGEQSSGVPIQARPESLTIRDPVHRATSPDHARWAARKDRASRRIASALHER